MTNNRSRCVATNSLGTATSNAATLTVITGTPGTYTTWRTTNFTGTDLTNGTISGPAADPDGAGVTNFQRYAFNLAARGRVAAPATLGTVASGGSRYLTLAFGRRAAATDLSYVVEASTDLLSWIALATYAPGNGSIVAVDSVAIELAEPARRFLRVRVTAP